MAYNTFSHRVSITSLNNHDKLLAAVFPNQFFHNCSSGNSEIFEKYKCCKSKYQTSSVSNLFAGLICGHSLLVTLLDATLLNSWLTKINNKEKHPYCSPLLSITRSLLVEDISLNKLRNLEADLETKASVLPTDLLSSYFIICTNQKSLETFLETPNFIMIAPVKRAVGYSS